MAEEYKVRISDYKISESPDKIITLGLGSCVGIALYDTKTKVGGLGHIMLPDSSRFSDKDNVEKFADLAIPAMVKEIEETNKKSKNIYNRYSNKDSYEGYVHGNMDIYDIKNTNRNLVAKIAGGASMFNFSEDIGKQNILAVEKKLEELGIPLVGKHTGGKSGRTMLVDLDDFNVDIRIVNGDTINI